jgi:tRNA pseudouridine32 synthase/23S rRNA pseudouridine746 synthase
MAAMGAPINNDCTYPRLVERAEGKYSSPLQLVAKHLSFTDPLRSVERRFSASSLLKAKSTWC